MSEEIDMAPTVLVIDDDFALTELYSFSLKRQGFEVLVAHGGEEGIALTKESKPDVLLVDLMMPGTSGWDVIREVRTFSDVPILVLSAVVDSTQVMKALDLGATDYLVKPTPDATLVARLNRLTRQARITRKSTGTP